MPSLLSSVFQQSMLLTVMTQSVTEAKQRCIFDGLNDVYSKYYALSEYLTVDEVSKEG